LEWSPLSSEKVILPTLFLSITAWTTLRVENQPLRSSDTLPTTSIRWHVYADCMSRTSQNANTMRGLELPSAFHYHLALKRPLSSKSRLGSKVT
jgi:hypothetical protein